MIESKGYKITPIDGDLAVNRNAEIGRDVDIQGKARVAGSLKVEGFLDAPHIKGAAKGLFNSVEELTREYPNPRPGWFAIVLDAANKETGILYKAENKAWAATTEEAKPYEFIKDSVNVFASKGELEDVRSEGVALDGVTVESLESEVNIVLSNIKGNVLNEVIMPSATTEYAGIMSAGDKRNLDYSTVRKITWNNDTDLSNMNDFVVAGVYDIKGERTRSNDNLPITNIGGGHTFNARLTVLDSSITGSGNSDDKCITQVLSFNNRLGQGEVYIRTGKGSSLDSLTWEKWSTLQRNVNVGQVYTLDDLIDNGIYSGVLTTTGEMFVLVVINNYAVAGNAKSVSQFKYSIPFGGSFAKYETRVGGGNPVSFPYAWEILNKNEIDSMIKSSVDNAIKGVIADAPEAFDTLKEIADWIANAETGATALTNAISANTKAINTEVTRAKDEEQKLNTAITAEATRAKNKENELATAINTGLNDIGREFTEANGDIKGMAMQYNTLGLNAYADKAEIYGRSIDGKIRTVDFPAATTEKAGVMSAEDKDKLNNSYKNIDVSPNKIDVELDIEDNTGNTHHIPIPAATIETAGVMSPGDKKALNNSVAGGFEIEPVNNGVAINHWSNDGKSYAAVIPYATERYAGVMSAADKKNLDSIPNEIEKIKDGKTIVGQAREIHSRNGKTVTDSFLVRTTAGSGTIGDGVASLKSVGGNIVKNSVDGMFESGTIPVVNGHTYYASAIARNESISFNGKTATAGNEWILLSIREKVTSSECVVSLTGNKSLVTNLTEMFGAGNEPDQATCDKLFGTMDALPQGLTIAKPTEFTSTDFNQFNPDNVLEGKAITNNVIVDGDKKIAVIPCLPCKIGVGENNGYCIHGDFGDDIKVYLTPLNPMEVDGELFMHELAKDATTDTYVPQIKGYMLIEVPTTANLCAHFLWSEDKCERDSYEPYHESKVELPEIPQMSEWGLAGVQSSGILACDEIDFERGVYRKKIGAVDLGSLNWATSVYLIENNNTQVYVTHDIANNIKHPKSDERANVSCNRYTTKANTPVASTIDIFKNNMLMIYSDGRIIVRDDSQSLLESFKTSLQGVMLYYELATPEEYPLPKVDNNYISSDYGVEQFDSVVPCNANNLYYMRSLAGETRNFLDRLMAGLETDDATAVADRILAVVNPVVEPANVEPEIPIEE